MHAGAFTSGKSVEETSQRLQELLEVYIGGLLKAGEPVPKPAFHHPQELKMVPDEDFPVICTPLCNVQIPES